MHESLKRPEIVCERAAFQGIEIGLAILGPHRDGWISFAKQPQIHQKSRGAPVAVPERVDRRQTEMGVE